MVPINIPKIIQTPPPPAVGSKLLLESHPSPRARAPQTAAAPRSARPRGTRRSPPRGGPRRCRGSLCREAAGGVGKKTMAIGFPKKKMILVGTWGLDFVKMLEVCDFLRVFYHELVKKIWEMYVDVRQFGVLSWT